MNVLLAQGGLSLTFGPQVPVQGAMLCKATAAFVALEWLLTSMVTDMTHQGALFPEALAAELAHIGLLIQMRSEMDLLGILLNDRNTEDRSGRWVFCGNVRAGPSHHGWKHQMPLSFSVHNS